MVFASTLWLNITHKQTNKQTNKQINKQTNKQTQGPLDNEGPLDWQRQINIY